MTNAILLMLLGGLFTKHFVVDFPLQVPYHYTNKGTYGHPGGIMHSLYHAIGTALVVYMFAPVSILFTLILAVGDGVIHYHVDWAKMNINKYFKWGPTTHEQFWWLLGLDQFVHALTYLGIAYIIAWRLV